MSESIYDRKPPERVLRMRISVRKTGLEMIKRRHAAERAEKEQAIKALEAEYELRFGKNGTERDD